MSQSVYSLEVEPTLPDRLSRLSELANNIVYSWQRDIRALFFTLDNDLWKACNHNPVLFLRRVQQNILDEAATDDDYLARYHTTLQWYDAYCASPANSRDEQPEELTAYFCAEFGLHESLPIYSGGLGILAGDHCKAASDMSLPLVAVGLLYHQGYFTQSIDQNGNQQAHYLSNDFINLPVELLSDENNNDLLVPVPINNRNINVRIWQVNIGKIHLYLLDSDVPSNNPDDRRITKRLYDGSPGTRINQEIVLGIGGVRALRALNLNPSVWHINEGHAAFSILERCRELVAEGLDFDTALEKVAAATVFTTHTPVSAGHDRFDPDTLTHHLGGFLGDLDIDAEKLMALGSTSTEQQEFNMTTLGLRGSRFHNGVSQVHRDVAASMEAEIWPQISPAENPITHITNGVHVESFLDKDWVTLFDQQYTGWRQHIAHTKFWQQIYDIDNAVYWQCHQGIKKSLLNRVKEQLQTQLQHNGASQALIAHSVRYIDQYKEDLLVLGFARRFATYKRATLLFYDHQRLLDLVNHEPPLLIIFAGKAHPDDGPGKELIRIIHEYSQQPEFIGKIVLLEGYDMALARLLVAGSDVWLNTPEYPMEACGTSGQKAGINGVANLSVLDGWWAEGYNRKNGWAIAPHDPELELGFRNRQESADLLDILEHGVIPAYFERGEDNLPKRWIDISKASMASVIPHFSSRRMLSNYRSNLYQEASRRGKLLANNEKASQLTQWKYKIRSHWSGVQAERIDTGVEQVTFGGHVDIAVNVTLNNLHPDDLLVECLVGHFSSPIHRLIPDQEIQMQVSHCLRLTPGEINDGQCRYSLQWSPESCGVKHYKLRVYPYHSLLCHPFEMGFMLLV